MAEVAGVELAGPIVVADSLASARRDEGATGWVTAEARGAAGSGSAEAAVKCRSGVECGGAVRGEAAAVGRGPLGAGGERNASDEERGRGETLHEDILRLIAEGGRGMSGADGCGAGRHEKSIIYFQAFAAGQMGCGKGSSLA
jgi:hypothetical protein